MKSMMLLRSLSYLACLFLTVATTGCAASEKHQMIRFYKLNKKDQQNRVLMNNKKAALSGCHNFLRKPRIYRITQIGFSTCRLYLEADCQTDSVIEGLWDEEKSSSDLTQGGQWLFTAEDPKGTKVKSWSCE